MRCREQWFNEHWQTCLNAVGEIDKQVLPLDDAWYVEYEYNWNRDTQEHNPLYYIRNKNMGIRQLITRQQEQSQEDIEREWNHLTIDDSQARELAEQLGLAKAS